MLAESTRRDNLISTQWRYVHVVNLPFARQRVPLDPPERQVGERVGGVVRCAGGVRAGVGISRRRTGAIKHIVQLFNLFRAVLGLGSDRDEAPRRLSEGRIGMAAQPAECHGEEFHLCSRPELEES